MRSAAQLKISRPHSDKPDEPSSVAAEVIAGLSQTPKQVAPKYFYDQAGSALFDEITELDEYYLPRVEKSIFEKHREAICTTVGEGKTLVEPGAGSCEKIKWLLPETRPAAYVPMDISADHLFASADALTDEFPDLAIEPQVCDHTHGIELEGEYPDAPPVFFYPGSSIGNYEPERGVEFLRAMREQLSRTTQPSGGLLIGVDTKKDEDVLQAAYDDAEGITARFNLNVLNHLNRLLNGNLDTANFTHHALYNGKEGRIEMHLRSRVSHSAELAGHSLNFDEGELVHTENSYKYHPDEFIELAKRAGFAFRNLWQDQRGWFSVMYFAPA